MEGRADQKKSNGEIQEVGFPLTTSLSLSPLTPISTTIVYGLFLSVSLLWSMGFRRLERAVHFSCMKEEEGAQKRVDPGRIGQKGEEERG